MKTLVNKVVREITTLRYQEVYQCYALDGLSDSEIAKRFKVDRTAVVHFRKRHNIPPRIYTGEIGEGIVVRELEATGFGFVVVNMNERSKLHPYDLLVNGIVRIDVKSAMAYQGSWSFSLSQKPETGIIESDRYTRLNNGRLRKRFCSACDFVILCGIEGDRRTLFIIPSSEIPETQQSIKVYQAGQGKWWDWSNRFDLIREVIANHKKNYRAM